MHSDMLETTSVDTRLLPGGSLQICLLGRFHLTLGGDDKLFDVTQKNCGGNSETQGEDGLGVRHNPFSAGPLFWSGARVLRLLTLAEPSRSSWGALGGLAMRRRCRCISNHLNTLIQSFAPKELIQMFAKDGETSYADIATFWRDIDAWDKTFSGANFQWRKMSPVLARMGFPPHSQLDSLMQGLQEEIQSAGIGSRGTFQALCGVKNLAPFVRGGQLNKKLLKALDAVVRSRGRKAAIRLFDALTPECVSAIEKVLDKLVTLAWLDEGKRQQKIATQFLTMSFEALMHAASFNQRYDSFLSIDLHDLVNTFVPGSTMVPVLDLDGWAAKTIVVDRYLNATEIYKNSTLDSLHSRALDSLELSNKVPPGLVTGWPVPLPATAINGFIFEPIETVVDLLLESRRQGSCLDKYGRKAATGHAFLYRIQATSGYPFVETATVEFCRAGESGGRVAISEIRGQSNSEVPPALVTVAQKFAEMIEQALQGAPASLGAPYEA